MTRPHLIVMLLLALFGVLLFACPVHAAGKPLSLSLAPSSQAITEGQSASLILNKSGGNGRVSPAKVTTSDGSFSASIAPGTSFTVPTKDDTIVNGQRTVTVTATASTGATAKAAIVINDNDVAPTPSPSSTTLPYGEEPIADTFDTSLGLQPSYGTGAIPAVSPDPVGAFRFMCLPGQVAWIDPIVSPGGVSTHLHQFWGNTSINPSSTYQTMRASGGSTCDNRSTPATAENHTGYWMPAMLDGAGHVVLPDFINTYYKQLPKGDPACQGPPDFTHQGWCIQIPNGIRFVFGFNPVTMKGGPNDPTGLEYYSMWYECWSDLIGTHTTHGATGRYHTIADTRLAGCHSPDVLVTQGVIPVCWNGQTDSADHRSHIADYLPDTANGIRCPADHPYVLPSAQFRAEFTTDANFDLGNWHLSSDEMMTGFVAGPSSPVKAGTTLHYDYFEAWSPTVKDRWGRNCIDKHLTCANGDLGDGYQMKEAGFPVNDPGVYLSTSTDRHRLVAVPARP
jgi:hypothetical protein